MSRATRSPDRRRTINGHPDVPILDELDFGLDTLTESIHRLAITHEAECDPLLSFEPTDKILCLTSTSKVGRVGLYRDCEPENVIMDWTLTAYQGNEKKKTLSILIRGHGLHPVAAKSGWSEFLNQDISGDIYSPINGTKYTEMAWQLCRSLGCDLTPNKGIERNVPPGYFEASHAEMHLIAWFVERYFPRLLEDGPKIRRLEPPQFLENILIISNRKPYLSCRQLAKRVKKLTGVTFAIEYRGPDS